MHPSHRSINRRQFASGITAINVTVSAETFEATTRTIALWQGEADRYPTLLSVVRRHTDIVRAKKDGTLGLMLGFQGPRAPAARTSGGDYREDHRG